MQNFHRPWKNKTFLDVKSLRFFGLSKPVNCSDRYKLCYDDQPISMVRLFDKNDTKSEQYALSFSAIWGDMKFINYGLDYIKFKSLYKVIYFCIFFKNLEKLKFLNFKAKFYQNKSFKAGLEENREKHNVSFDIAWNGYHSKKWINGFMDGRHYWKKGGNWTILTLAARYADKKIVQFLLEELKLESEANPNGPFNRTSFLSAVVGGKIETLKYLNAINSSLKYDLDSNKGSALTLAGLFGKQNTVEYLLDELKIDPLTNSGYGNEQRSVFLGAASQGNIILLKYLNTKFPNLKYERDSEQNNALGFACEFADKKTVQFLIERLQINYNETGFRKRNCFLSAAAGHKIETLKYLDSNYPELKNERDAKDSTALGLAASWARPRTIEFLLKQIKMHSTEN